MRRKKEGGISAGKRLTSPEKRVQIQVTNFKALKAKSGDRIAVQVLFCPYEWNRVIRGERVEQLRRLQVILKTPRTPIMSNKAEFVVP